MLIVFTIVLFTSLPDAHEIAASGFGSKPCAADSLFTLRAEATAALFGVSDGRTAVMEPRYNIAPTRVRCGNTRRRGRCSSRELVMLRWGLIPYLGQGAVYWQSHDQCAVRKPSPKSRPIEMRTNIVAASSLRTVSIEWQQAGRRQKTPYYHFPGQWSNRLVIAALWEKLERQGKRRDLSSLTTLITDTGLPTNSCTPHASSYAR